MQTFTGVSSLGHFMFPLHTEEMKIQIEIYGRHLLAHVVMLLVLFMVFDKQSANNHIHIAVIPTQLMGLLPDCIFTK